MLKSNAADLCYWVNICFPSNDGSRFGDVERFQKYFDTQYQIMVYGRVTVKRKYEKTKWAPKTMKIMDTKLLRYEESHYDVNHNVTSF